MLIRLIWDVSRNRVAHINKLPAIIKRHKMIKKIIKIKGVGKYLDYKINRELWDGELSKENVIYGENGTGKTTLTLIFRSLSGKNNLIQKKKTFGFAGDQEINLLDDSNNPYEFKGNKWDKFLSNIEVFDIHFIEDNIYTGSIHEKNSQSNLFEIIVGEEGLKLKRKSDDIFKLREENRRDRKRFANQLKFQKNSISESEKDFLVKQIKKLDIDYKQIVIHLKGIQRELGEYSKNIFDKYVEVLNEKLKFFTPYIEIKKFSKTMGSGNQYVSYFLLVSGHQVGFEENSAVRASFKYTLSEGDKSALAFSFFLAKLHFTTISDKIIVFDDPISSFDYARKNSTINQLFKLSKECNQLITLTHDINFAKDLCKRFSYSKVKSLKIVRQGTNNVIATHDIEKETLSGVFKDIEVLNNHIIYGSNTDLEKREVIRCIRPILEGILRIKFFRDIKFNEWLGDVIRKVNESKEGERLFRLKPLVDEISEINDYSKGFHHSDSTSAWGEVINDEELLIYVNRTLKLIDKI